MPLRPLTTELAEKARLELNEDPKRIESDLQHIKEWLDKQPHLRARRDDQWLIAFLRGCKYSLERTKAKLDLYYSMRTLVPEVFLLHHKEAKFKEILSMKSQIILPKLVSPDAPRVIIFRPAAHDPAKHVITDVFAVLNAMQKHKATNVPSEPVVTTDAHKYLHNQRLYRCVDHCYSYKFPLPNLKILLVDDDSTVVAGVRTIMDFEGATMSHLLQITPSLMKKMVVMSQDVNPLRIKGEHYINTPPGFETIYNAFKVLLNEKNRSRLFVHNKNYEELYKYVPKEILPIEYGGSGGTIDEITDYWSAKFEEYSPWLDEDFTFGTDEQKRPGQPKTAESIFGVEGSFRKLEFD